MTTWTDKRSDGLRDSQQAGDESVVGFQLSVLSELGGPADYPFDTAIKIIRLLGTTRKISNRSVESGNDAAGRFFPGCTNCFLPCLSLPNCALRVSPFIKTIRCQHEQVTRIRSGSPADRNSKWRFYPQRQSLRLHLVEAVFSQ